LRWQQGESESRQTRQLDILKIAAYHARPAVNIKPGYTVPPTMRPKGYHARSFLKKKKKKKKKNASTKETYVFVQHLLQLTIKPIEKVIQAIFHQMLRGTIIEPRIKLQKCVG
jgi:hypothetical protein